MQDGSQSIAREKTMRKAISLTAITIIASGCAGAGQASSTGKLTITTWEEIQKQVAVEREQQKFQKKVKYKGNACAQKGQQPFEVSATTLLDALKAYERQFNIAISKHVDAPGADIKLGEKYFLFTDNLTGAQGLIDIHVIRNGEEICPKQNTDFALLGMDQVVYIPVPSEDSGKAPDKNIADTLQRLPGVTISQSAAC